MSDYSKTDIGSGYNTNTAVNTELGKIETAVNSKVDKSGSTMTGDLDMNSNKILNVADGTSASDAVNYGQLINRSSYAAADAKFFDTVAAAQADNTLAVGDVIIIKERVNAIFDVITATSNNGYDIIDGTASSVSLQLRVNPSSMDVRAFGAKFDGATDDTTAIQTAVDSVRTVILPAGTAIVTVGIQQPTDSEIIGQGVDKTIIKAQSPTADNTFGGGGGVIHSLGAEGSPVYNTKVKDLTIDCDWLDNTGGAAFLKGLVNGRTFDFENSRVKVLRCASYAFWAFDKTVEDGGYTFASGVYNDCESIDQEIAFETTNVRGVVYNRCRATQSGTAYPAGINALETFHMYGGEDMQLVFNNCYGKVNSSTVVGPLLTCKNVTFNDCYFEQENASNAAINMIGFSATAKFDNWTFNNTRFVSTGLAATMAVGDLADTDAEIKISNCEFIGAEGVGLQLNGSGKGVYNIANSRMSGTATSPTVPFGLFVNGTVSRLNVIGGSCEAYGAAVGSGPTNASSSNFTACDFTPAGAALPQLRQHKFGSGTLISDTTYSYLSVQFDNAIADWPSRSKVTCFGTVDADGAATGADAAAEATVISFIMLDNQTVRFYADIAAAGREFNYEIREFL